MAFKLKIIFLLNIIVLVMVLKESSARPGASSEYGDWRHENRCDSNDQHVVVVCQRCAKQTKSPIVYPMCCENEEDVYNWCDKYINYGKQA